MSEKFIFSDHYELDWDDIERKVQLISRRFSNIDYKYCEDLEQELRLFALTTSSHYQHMYRKAIDYWRHLTAHVYPEVCIFDVEDNDGNKLLVPEESYEDKVSTDVADKIMSLVHRELDRYAQTKSEQETVEVCRAILEFVGYEVSELPNLHEKEVPSRKYQQGHLSISWIADQTGYKYKKVQEAFNVLKEIIQTLVVMKKIVID